MNNEDIYSEKYLKSKIMSWLISLIDVNDMSMRKEYIPLYELINDCLEFRHGEIESSYSDGDNKFTFRMELIQSIKSNKGMKSSSDENE